MRWLHFLLLLHWHMAAVLGWQILQEEGLWLRIQPIQLGQRALPMSCLEQQLLALCLNLNVV